MGIKQKAIQIICFLFFIQSLKAQLNCKDYVKLINSLNLIKYNNLYYSATSDSINFERLISYANINDTSILKEISISVIQPSNQNLNFEHCFDVNLNKININDFLLLKDTIVLTKSENRKVKRYEELLKKSIELLGDENFSVSKEKRLHKRINKIDLELINKKIQ